MDPRFRGGDAARASRVTLNLLLRDKPTSGPVTPDRNSILYRIRSGNTRETHTEKTVFFLRLAMETLPERQRGPLWRFFPSFVFAR